MNAVKENYFGKPSSLSSMSEISDQTGLLTIRVKREEICLFLMTVDAASAVYKAQGPDADALTVSHSGVM